MGLGIVVLHSCPADGANADSAAALGLRLARYQSVMRIAWERASFDSGLGLDRWSGLA